MLLRPSLWLKVPSLVVATFLATAVPLLAFAALSNDDKVAIGEQVQLIVQAVNTGNPAPVRSIISPNARPTLLAELEDALAGNPIEFQESISSYNEITPDMVRVKGRFAAKTPNWSMSGLGNSFIFERVDGKWILKTKTQFGVWLRILDSVAILKEFEMEILANVGNGTLDANIWLTVAAFGEFEN